MRLSKRFIIMVLVLFVTTLLIVQFALASEDEPSSNLPLLAVLPLKATGSHGRGDIDESIYQLVTTAFFRTKRFDIVERAQLDKVLNEGRLQHTVIADDNSAVTLGKQLGVKTVIIGSYKTNTESQYGGGTRTYSAHIEINLRLVEVQTGKVKSIIRVSASNKSAGNDDAVAGMTKKVSDKLNREVYNLYPLTGYVIKIINENEVLIDLGKKDGVAPGNEFAAVEYGEDIIHPVTGKVIKGEKKILTEFEIVRVSEETSVAKISGKEMPIKIGLALESKPKKAGFWESASDLIN